MKNLRNSAQQAFTLAEMMVVLLIMTIILAAMAPVMTTRMSENKSSQGASIWRYIDGSGNSDIYFGTKSSQRVVIGQNSAATAENARLVINTSTSVPNHIMFRNGGNTTGIIKMDSNGSIAIGNGAEATGNYSVAIGYNVKVNTANTITLGTSTETVRIPGTLYVQATNYPSDRNLKNVGSEYILGLNEIKQLKPYNFTYKNDEKKTPRVAVIAQDLKKVFPNAVKKGSDGYLSIRMEDMFYAVINAIKELDAKITALTQTVKQVQEDTYQLKKENKELREIIIQVQNDNKMLKKRLEVLEK